MNNLKNRLIAFMYGRYGIDEMYRGLLVLWGILWLLSAFTGNPVFSLLSVACLGYMIFRAFSKNIAARRAENEKFRKFWNPVKSFFKLQWLRVKECRTHVYRTCPQCRANLRLPRRKGEHNAVCPRCGSHFAVRIHF